MNECKWLRRQVATNMTMEFEHFKDKIGKEFHNTMAQQWGILEKNFFKDCEGLEPNLRRMWRSSMRSLQL